MKITYISHATLLIEVDGVKIVTDPWVTGSAYCNKWHLFPKPLNPDKIKDADFVLYSHGHEDHLHIDSLNLINKNATIYYPYSWFGGIIPYLNSNGYKNVKESLNEKTINLTEKIKVTYLSNNLDNVVVIESGNTVLININDALPSASQEMIELFINKINKRWKHITYLFSSYGGASYFPNTVHYKEKNDVEIAETRELFFVNNFSKIVNGLQPKIAVPFASDFVLLQDNQRWMNFTKFPRNKISEFYHQKYPSDTNIKVIESYPNDYFENNTFHKDSIYHAKFKTANPIDTIDSDYALEIHEINNAPKINTNQLNDLYKRLEAHIIENINIIPYDTRRKIKFALKIIDSYEPNIFNISFRGENPKISLGFKNDEDIDLLIEISSKILLYSMDNEWGGDAIIIGYGAEIYIFNEDAVISEYENYCIRLLSRYPNTKKYLKKDPFRTIRYLMSDETKRKNLVLKLMGKQDKTITYSDAILGKRNLWLTKSKCDVCKACNI